ncbi:MAG: Fic family protein [Alphaproteobacteria bacterium]|nr:Fic family protein [Alphaproteobacteria bacterium]MBQ8630857.1 Fic family protein [Alphaproteobacteria bacterium]
MYIHKQKNWPDFIWKNNELFDLITKVSFKQGALLGKMQSLGFDFRQEALLNNLTEEITKSSEIEGELLNKDEVRSSIARRLNIHNEKSVSSSHHIDGVVEIMIDATHNFEIPLTYERLCSWHAALFPTGYSGMYKIKTACYRDDKDGPMQVVSNNKGREIVYYEAPDASLIKTYMDEFFGWINKADDTNPLIKAAISHLWFITIHPFEDGNGRIARAVTEFMLAKAEKSSYRFYSMSAQIQKQKNEYYKVLENTQKGTLDITNWIKWFLETMLQALETSEIMVSKIIFKAEHWMEFNKFPLDENQKKMINMLFDGFEGNMTSSKWAKICKCSQDTASRSIKQLVEYGILKQQGNGRSTHFILTCGE